MALHFQIDPQSGVPVYRQVMDQVKYYVAAGTLKAGNQLPSIRELAQTLTVNPTTVVKAYNELSHEKVIEIRHGKGAFVAAKAVGMSHQEKEEALRRSVRSLAVESTQMAIPTTLVLEMLREELERLKSKPPTSWPAKITVLTR